MQSTDDQAPDQPSFTPSSRDEARRAILRACAADARRVALSHGARIHPRVAALKAALAGVKA